MRKFSKKLKALRRHVKEVEGISMVSAIWVKAILSRTQLKIFEKKYVWKKDFNYCICPICKERHLDKRKFRRYAYFWNLVSLLDMYVKSDIEVPLSRSKKHG